MRTPLRVTLLSTLLFSFAGCSAHRLSINAFSAPGIESKLRSCFIVPGDKNISIEDLEFNEYADYIDLPLAKMSYIRTSDPSVADTLIILMYGNDKPIQHQEMISLPIFGQKGGGMSYTNALVMDQYGNSAYGFGSTYTEPEYGIIGSQSFASTSYSFPIYLSVNAYDIIRKDEKINLRPLWRTFIFTAGKTPDRRAVMPYMVAGGMDYFGKNTKRAIEVSVSDFSTKRKMRLIRKEPL